MEKPYSYPSREELLVNSVLMNKCNHGMHVAELETAPRGSPSIIFTCTECGLTVTEIVELPYFASREEKEKEIEKIDISRRDAFLSFKVNKLLSDKISIEAVLREIKKQGWVSKIVSKNSQYQCVVTNDHQNIKGELSSNELDAIASSLYELARIMLRVPTENT